MELAKRLEALTLKQQKELDRILTQDILERYDNEEYHNPKIIEGFLQDVEAEENN